MGDGEVWIETKMGSEHAATRRRHVSATVCSANRKV
jgi:hypothetical protein